MASEKKAPAKHGTPSVSTETVDAVEGIVTQWIGHL